MPIVDRKGAHRSAVLTAGMSLVLVACRAGSNGPDKPTVVTPEPVRIPVTVSVPGLPTATWTEPVPTATRTVRPTRTPRPPTITPLPPTPDAMATALHDISLADGGSELTISNGPVPLIYRVARIGPWQLSMLENPPQPGEEPYLRALLRNPDCLPDHMATTRVGSGRLIFTDPHQLTSFRARVDVADSIGAIPVLTLTGITLATGEQFNCPPKPAVGGRIGDRLRNLPGQAGSIGGFTSEEFLEGLRHGWNQGQAR